MNGPAALALTSTNRLAASPLPRRAPAAGRPEETPPVDPGSGLGEEHGHERAWLGFLAVGAASIIAYFLWDNPLRDFGYNIMGLIGAVAIVVAVVIHKPDHRAPWFMLAAGLVFYTAGDFVWTIHERILHEQPPYPSYADALYLAGPPLWAAAVISILKRRVPGRDRAGIIDALVIATGAGMVSWVFFMHPYVGDSSLTLIGKAVSFAYPLMDVLLLGILARLALVRGDRPASLHLLTLGFVVLLVGDIVYTIQGLNGTYYSGHPVDATWMSFYWIMGAAALHPSMTRLSERIDVAEERLTRVRLAGLAAAALLAPAATIALGASSGRETDAYVLGLSSAAVFLLVILRMLGLVRDVESKVDQLSHQEQTLRASLQQRDLLQSELQYRALHDALTDLPNRFLFTDRVEDAVDRFSRSYADIAVIFIDIDDFKGVNDTLGHQAGDELLVAVGKRLNSCTRGSDLAARLGGDEFAILLDGMAAPQDALIVADRILETIRLPFLLDGRQMNVSCSLGIAMSHPGVSVAGLLRNADVAMYVAKNRGKDGFAVYEPEMHTEVLGRIKLRTELDRALSAGQFRAFYQPIVDLKSGRLIGAEALVRWEHPERGLVPPLDFLPLAEETGQIVAIDEWMLAEACTKASRFKKAVGTDFAMSVNLSGRTLQSPGFVDRVRRALDQGGLDPSALILEITESALIKDTETAVLRLHELRRIGVRLAIDDFGTGYSSLNYLRRFPIDFLKIDKTFVDGIAKGAEDAALGRAIMMMAETLELNAIAEGIEDPDQVGELVRIRTDWGQGYFFSPPITEAEMASVAERSKSSPLRPIPSLT
jgi:diguanylate cyclase